MAEKNSLCFGLVSTLNKYIFFSDRLWATAAEQEARMLLVRRAPGDWLWLRMRILRRAKMSRMWRAQRMRQSPPRTATSCSTGRKEQRAGSREQGTVCRKRGAKGASRMTTKDTAAAAPAGPQDARRERERRPQGLCLRMQVGENSWRTKTEQQQRHEGPMSGRRKDILCRQTHILTKHTSRLCGTQKKPV